MTPGESTAPEHVGDLLEHAFNGIGIPPRPKVLEAIRAEMLRNEPDMARMTGIISSDVSLSASVMKSANSPYFGLSGRARTVPQALAMLGLDITARAVSGMVLRNTFGATTSFERFWDASARIAQLSGWLATQLGQDATSAGDAYSFGLFRDCGIPVMMRRFPDYTMTLGLANQEAQRPFTAIEDSRHPTNHAVVGCQLARTWGLPESSCQAIRHHHDFTFSEAGQLNLSGESTRLIAIAQFSERILQKHTGLSQTREWDKLGADCLRILQLDEAQEDRLAIAALSVAGNDLI